MPAFAEIVDPGHQQAVDAHLRKPLDAVDDLFRGSDQGVAAMAGLEVEREGVQYVGA